MTDFIAFLSPFVVFRSLAATALAALTYNTINTGKY
jgi:hypothetical protein